MTDCRPMPWWFSRIRRRRIQGSDRWNRQHAYHLRGQLSTIEALTAELAALRSAESICRKIAADGGYDSELGLWIDASVDLTDDEIHYLRSLDPERGDR